MSIKSYGTSQNYWKAMIRQLDSQKDRSKSKPRKKRKRK